MKKTNKYTLLHRSNERFAKKNLELLSDNAKLKDELTAKNKEVDSAIRVIASHKAQINSLEKTLVANEVELLRKIVALYEDKHSINNNHYNGNGITTTSTYMGV
tara:strand:- start:45 stop:356 length:312 start_codon:yes stop_codon:yes gene_type:complete